MYYLGACVLFNVLFRQKWNTCPYTKGVYSYFSLASSRSNYTPVDLSNPEWSYAQDSQRGEVAYSLLFAGEATHPDFFSTVHGAVLSGQREADRIASYYTVIKTNSGNDRLEAMPFLSTMTVVLFSRLVMEILCGTSTWIITM